MAESPIQSSFIPHDTGSTVTTKQFRSSSGLYDLLMLVSIVLFIASAVLGVGVFLYKQFLQTEAASKHDQLERAKAAFEPALIQKLTRLDDRMHSADELLASHLAPTTFFKVLEQTTLQTVAFGSLDLEAGDPKSITLKMSGDAQSVNSIALQADLFSKSTVFKSPIFSGINRGVDGVHFDVTANVNPAILQYAQVVNGQSAAAAAASVIESDVQTPSSTPQAASPFERAAQGTKAKQ